MASSGNDGLPPLVEVDDKANWLMSRRKGTNYEIPESIKIIIPIVVSPFVEYIWSTNEDLWLTKEIPRICTLKELKELVLHKHTISEKHIRYVK
jgi:hypothetical protein